MASKVKQLDKDSIQGQVIKAFGNLVHVTFDGDIKQGEIGLICMEGVELAAEVIEISGNEAKLQVYDDTRGIKLFTPVRFTKHLLEAELGPGLLTSIFDGLQNPLEKIADIAGLFLKRGVSVPALDRKVKWEFFPTAKEKQTVQAGDELGYVEERTFRHKIMVPFSFRGSYQLKSLAKKGSYTIEETIATLISESMEEKAVTMLQKWPVKMALRQGKKIKPSQMMDTGLRLVDTQLPLLKGGTFCSPGPFGAGKTVLQHHLSKYSSVDMVVIAACGERAGEVVEVLREFPHLTDARTNKPLMERTVIICNTSSMPVAAREASVYMGVTIAEYYRQMGYNVLLLADSTSRWAQAMREISGRLEEIPGEEAFPAYLSSRIAAFYERAGVIELKEGKTGSVTIGGTVSPAGGSFEEPVTQATLSVVGAFLGLSRARSDARRYPAVDPLISWTKYLYQAASTYEGTVDDWGGLVKRADTIIRKTDEIAKRMEVVGEEGTAMEDMIIYLKGELYDNCYLQQNAFDKEDAYCPLERQIELFLLIQNIFKREFRFESHDEARTFFLQLQNTVKNMNYLSFHSKEYHQVYKQVQQSIESKGRI